MSYFKRILISNFLLQQVNKTSYRQNVFKGFFFEDHWIRLC